MKRTIERRFFKGSLEETSIALFQVLPDKVGWCNAESGTALDVQEGKQVFFFLNFWCCCRITSWSTISSSRLASLSLLRNGQKGGFQRSWIPHFGGASVSCLLADHPESIRCLWKWIASKEKKGTRKKKKIESWCDGFREGALVDKVANVYTISGFFGIC